MMTSILEYLIRKYGKEYKNKVDEIRMDYKYGKDDKNKDKLDMIILKHLRENETQGKLDESDVESDVLNDIEEILEKENVGMNDQIKVPSQRDVRQDVKEKGNNDNNGNNREKEKEKQK